MDKNTYETYEYLPSNNAEAETGQFFIVQDDGTFLINRQQVQYVTEMQNEKEALDGTQQPQSCTVYDVTPQPFYVDVDNSAELISVPDNFIMPDAASGSNLYSNSYLLQTVGNTTADQIENAVAEQFKQTDAHVDVSIVAEINKKNSSCTEITLSDDQYNILEQKGWILLETNEKIFVLDNLGLHDITTNNELIEQLKSELQSHNSNFETSTSDVLNDTTVKYENIVTENSSKLPPDTFELVIANDGEKKIENQLPVTKSEVKAETNQADEKQTTNIAELPTITVEPLVPSKECEVAQQRSNTIKIKTKLSFKDVPDKIVLGKTVNGKKLVAKLVKRNNLVKPLRNQTDNTNGRSTDVLWTGDDDGIMNQAQLDDAISQLQYDGVKSTPEEVAAAEDIMMQLLQMPAFQTSVVDRSLCITRTIKTTVEVGDSEVETAPTLVTGKVSSTDGRFYFLHMPNLLHELMNGLEVQQRRQDNSPDTSKKRENSVLHVHIVETKRVNNVEAIAITLYKRQLPVKTPYESKRPQVKVYACSACATVFQCKESLTVHQESPCIETDDTLTIDTDMVPNDCMDSGIQRLYNVTKTNTGVVYSCIMCNLNFNKLSNCLRHVKTHSKPTKQDVMTIVDKKIAVNKSEGKKDIYKCKMCPGSYYHPSTLSKHIVAAHIKIK